MHMVFFKRNFEGFFGKKMVSWFHGWVLRGIGECMHLYTTYPLLWHAGRCERFYGLRNFLGGWFIWWMQGCPPNATRSEGRPQIHHEYGKLEEKKDKKLTTSLSHFFGPWPAGVLSQADKKQAGDTPSRKSLISPGQEWRSHEGHELSRTKELNISFSQGTFQYDFPFPYVSFLEHIWKPAPPWMVTQSPFLNSAYTPSQPYHNQFMESLYITPFRQLLAHHLFAFLCICHGCL